MIKECRICSRVSERISEIIKAAAATMGFPAAGSLDKQFLKSSIIVMPFGFNFDIGTVPAGTLSSILTSLLQFGNKAR